MLPKKENPRELSVKDGEKMRKNKYWSIQPILKTNADYNLIFGQRSNGKTFGCCGAGLTSYINNGARIAYVRRYAEEITPRNIENLFLPHPIDELTDGNYNGTVYRSHKFRLVKYDNGEIVATDDTVFCQTFALNTWERQKGADNGKFDYIIFDEFMTRGNYLPNEFLTFCNVLSTLLRDRAGTKIFMLANTVNRYSPYFAEMGLGEIVDTIKQGEIKSVRNKSGLKISVEYCAVADSTAQVNKYFDFNNTRLDMITNGKWEIKNYPHLTERVTKNDILARFYVFFDNKVFCGDLCGLNNDMFIHFHRGDKKEINYDKHFVYSDTPSINPMHSITIYNGNSRVQYYICDLIDSGKCFYTDNEIGEIVRNWLLHQRQIKQRFFD